MRLLLAAVPFIALTFAVPFVNRDQPRIAGIPFLLFWMIAWALLAPVFLWAVSRLERHDA